LGIVCGLAVLAGSAGCGPAARGRAETVAADAVAAGVVKHAVVSRVTDLSPAGALPVKADLRPAAAVARGETTVGGGARLYAASRRWYALIAPGPRLGGERIVLAGPRGGSRTVLDGALGRGEGLAVTGVRVSDSWLVWEEASQYDLELGGAARWRLLAAPIVGERPALGRGRVVDSGVVARRPRCDFALSGGRLAIASTCLAPHAAPGGRAGTRVLAAAATAGAPVATLRVVSLGSGRAVTLFEGAGLADSVSWAEDRIVATVTDVSRAQRASALVFDGAGERLGRVRLARGLEFAGPATARGDLVAAPVARSGLSDGELLVFAVSGQPLWRGPEIGGAPLWLGERVVAAGPAATREGDPPAWSLLDPISGASRAVSLPRESASARRAPAVVDGPLVVGQRLLLGFRGADPSGSSGERLVVRSLAVP
jgi:hypothetical protein